VTLTHETLALEDYIEGDACQQYADAWAEQLRAAQADARIKGDERDALARKAAHLDALCEAQHRVQVRDAADIDEARGIARGLLRVAREQRRFGIAVTTDGEHAELDEVAAVSRALAALEPGVRKMVETT
jgi:hypothetical protein